MSLKSKTFAITGTLSLPRQQIVDWITARGGVVLPSVTKKVTHLIVSDPRLTTSKIEKAKQSGTLIIGEDDLKELDANPNAVIEPLVNTTPKQAKPKAVKAKAPAKAPAKPEAEADANVEAEANVEANAEANEEAPTAPTAPGGKGPLAGMTIALTGRLTKTKEEYMKLIAANGGTYAPTVTKKTTHLIAKDADSACDKLSKARKHGAKIVGEDFVLKLKPVVTTGAERTEQAEAAPEVLLAKAYEPDKHKIDGWWVSEKLDGVRAIWNGKRFMSRAGNEFYPPDWYKAALPKDRVLDGELFIGRKKFRETVSVVKSHEAGPRWKDVNYMVFDMPSEADKPFEERVALINQVCKGCQMSLSSSRQNTTRKFTTWTQCSRLLKS